MGIKNPLTKLSNSRLTLIAVATIFVILPFTTPLAVFLSSNVEQLSLATFWKEIVMILVAALILVSGAYKRLTAITENNLQILAWLVLTYCGWTLLLGLVSLAADRINWEAFIYALILNLRFLIFFLICWAVGTSGALPWKNWQRLLLVPAAVVVAFGLLQVFVLPANTLERIGYGPDTITAYQTVDQHPEYIRAQSTLRGPNPLGAYLVMVIAALLVGLRPKRRPQIALLAGSAIVLFYTYSRSAWLGIAITLAALAFISFNNPRLRQRLVIAGCTALILFAGIIYTARDNQFVQKTIFHTDETSLSPQSSNEQRTGAIQRGLQDVTREPLGRGPGSAGPASIHNNQPERIAENYYLQIGQEIGWIGLGLFLAINVLIGRLLWKQRRQTLAKVLLASLAGIALINLLSHAWTDETLSLLWWGLAGFSIAAMTRNGKDSSSPVSAKGKRKTTDLTF